MSEKNNFSNVQRLNSAVIAKHEWTLSLMGMQKSGEEVHDRRIKTNRKANKFLQELLDRRGDGSSLDDNGILDRYRHFLKYKSNFNDDDDILDEFNRRLRALNNSRRNQISKTCKSNSKESMTIGSQTANEILHHLDTKDQSQSLSELTQISTLNNSDISILSNMSSDESQTEIILNIDELTDQSSTYNLITKTLHRPIARRADGSEIIVISTEAPLQRASSNVLIFNHCFFPRSLTSHERVNTNIVSTEKLSAPAIEQYDNNQLFHLLDRIENKCSSVDFTTMLDQLTLSTVETDTDTSLISDNEDDDLENIRIIPNLFDQSSSLSHDYYTTLTINIDKSSDISLYTMTIGIVQLRPSILMPYSILDGRRPLLQCSARTDFKQIRSKREKHTCQVTAIDSLRNTKYLKENDILLKINNQSVWRLTTDAVRDILQKHGKQSNNCLLTIARLCRPLI